MTINNPIRVAIVDDHPTFRRGFIETVSEDGLEVMLEASDGKDLIEKLNSTRPLPHVCVTDIQMRGMNGYDLTTYLRSNYRDVKVLALSHFEHEFSIINVVKKGAAGYLCKTSTPEEIVKAIRSIRTHGFYHSDVVSEKIAEVLYNQEFDFKLSDKEILFLSYCCTELTYDEMAPLMNVSPRTVDGYRDKLFAKLHIKSRAGLVLFALQTGIAGPPQAE